MSTNDFVVKDYLTDARSRVTQQFKDKDVFDRYVQLLVYGSTQLQESYRQLIQNRSLDTASGVQLDIIGKLVGIDRGALPSVELEGSYFGFETDATALSFGDASNPSTGGFFLDLKDSSFGNVSWSDDIYRIYIKAKIFANTARGTPEELIVATKSILNVTSVDIVETGSAHLLLSFNRLLTPAEKVILKGIGEDRRILPIPVGVGVEYIESPEDFFGFAETPGAKSFASLTSEEGWGGDWGNGWGSADPTPDDSGGYFASLFS